MAQDLINTPPLRGPVDEENDQGQATGVTKVWSAWFTQVFQACFSLYQSGTKAQRPVDNLWVGRMYFDTSLGAHGKPIWYDKTANGWVDAAGNIV